MEIMLLAAPLDRYVGLEATRAKSPLGSLTCPSGSPFDKEGAGTRTAPQTVPCPCAPCRCTAVKGKRSCSVFYISKKKQVTVLSCVGSFLHRAQQEQ